jgi:hypothetical protein
MSELLVNLLIQVIAGAVGGNVGGAAKHFNLGSFGNTFSGASHGRIEGRPILADSTISMPGSNLR